jgi:peptidoglycan/xylan/chitin deacetylase (PgdA/CDA1 family)
MNKETPEPLRTLDDQPVPAALILMYHRVTRVGADPFSLNVTPEHFVEQLQVLKKHAQPVALRELTAALQTGNLRDRSVAITFDDGYLDNLVNAKPALEQAGIPATVFVTTGPLEHEYEFWWDELERIFLEPGQLPASLRVTIDGHTHTWELDDAVQYGEEDYLRYRAARAEDPPPTLRHALHFSIWQLLQPLSDPERRTVLDEIAAWAGVPTRRRGDYRTVTPEELRTLAQGPLIEIGGHTITHPVLPDLPAEGQEREIRESRVRLEQILGRPVTSFAYPYGMLSDDTADVVRDSGFNYACSTVPATVQLGADPLQLPRFQVDDWAGEEFEKRLAGWFKSAGQPSAPGAEVSRRHGKWQFRSAGGCAARFIVPSADPEGVRIVIEKASSQASYDIQLNLPRLQARANRAYSVSFRARADEDRVFSLGFSMAHEPWNGLGLYKRIEVTPEWKDFDEVFVSTADDENARIHFDIAESAISMELSGVSLRPLPERDSKAGDQTNESVR